MKCSEKQERGLFTQGISMSVMLEPPTNRDAPEAEETLPDASVLEDKTPEWCRMSAAVPAFLLVLGLVLMVFANRPLWHSDLWDHINYGEHILKHHIVSRTEPLVTLAEGMPTVNSAWLSQVGMAFLSRTNGLGLPALQFLHAALIVISLAAVGYTVTKRASSAAFGILSCAIFLAVNWQQFLIVRPQSVGVAFFSVVLAVLATGGIRHRFSWFALPLIFAVWANCHGSFAAGLLLMGLFVVGHVVDVLFRTRSISHAIRNRQTMQLVLLTQLCAAAALLNPSGLAIYHEVLRVGSHPNIGTMYEWDPLTLRMQQGQMAAGAALLLLLTLRVSPRRLRATEMLPLLVTGGMALWSGPNAELVCSGLCRGHLRTRGRSMAGHAKHQTSHTSLSPHWVVDGCQPWPLLDLFRLHFAGAADAPRQDSGDPTFVIQRHSHRAAGVPEQSGKRASGNRLHAGRMDWVPDSVRSPEAEADGQSARARHSGTSLDRLRSAD